MKRHDTNTLVAGLVIVAGVVLLLQNLGVFGPFQDILWALIFLGAGITFVSVTASNPTRWWALIPGGVLLSIGTLITLDQLAPQFANSWGGTIVLAGFSLGFWGILLTHREAWWAAIPGGVFTTLAVVAGLDQFAAERATGAAFFLGLAITFGLVYLIHGVAVHRAWALVVAGAMLVLGLLTFSAEMSFFGIFWPAMIILAGVVLLFRAFRRREPRTEPEQYDTTLPQSR